jgi:hypothetical protein
MESISCSQTPAHDINALKKQGNSCKDRFKMGILKKAFVPVIGAAILSLASLKEGFAQTASGSRSTGTGTEVKYTGNTRTGFTENKPENRETLKTFDYRGRGYDQAMDFVVTSKMPLLIGISGKDSAGIAKRIAPLKDLLKGLDAKGYENMGLMANDDSPSNKKSGEVFTIYCNGKMCGMIGKVRSNDGTQEGWSYVTTGQKAVFIGKGDPLEFLKKKIEEAYPGTNMDLAANNTPDLSQQ